MRILVHLNNQYGGKVTKEITYWGTLDQAKQDLYYVEYDGSYYEWVAYNTGYGGFDYIAEYSRYIAQLPRGHRAHVITNEYQWEAPIKCECGAEAVRHTGHSFWCPKYRRF